MYDVVVIGGGPAGLSAGLWLGRYRRKVLLLDGCDYRNAMAERMHGYLGRDAAVPAEFRARGRAELGRYETIEIREARVDGIVASSDGFTVTADGHREDAARLVLATGVVDEFPHVENFFDHYGADVFHCPSCEGYEATGRTVVVFGWSANVAGFALELLGWARSVTVVTDGKPFEGERRHRDRLLEAGARIVEDEAVALEGRRGRLRRVTLRSGSPVECDMAFFTIAHHPRTSLAEQLGCRRTDDGYLQVDEQSCTTVSGVFAAGDVTPGCQLVQVAAGQGTVAGTMCALSLRGEHPAEDAPVPAPAMPD